MTTMTRIFWTNDRVRHVGPERDGLMPGVLGTVIISNASADEAEIVVHFDGREGVNEHCTADELEFVAKGTCSCNGHTYDGEHRL